MAFSFELLVTNCERVARRSLAILTKDARYKYKHSISKELIEKTTDGNEIHRDRRISFTFREIIAWE